MKNKQAGNKKNVQDKNKQEWDKREELKEWLGITKAGGLMYLAFAIAITALFLDTTLWVAILLSAALLVSVYSTILGVKKNERVSTFTNIAKAISYPVSIGILMWIVLFKVIIMIKSVLGMS